MDDGPTHVRMALSEYAEYMRLQCDADPLYLFDYEIPASLMQECLPIKFFAEDYLEDIGQQHLNAPSLPSTDMPDILSERNWLVIGPKGSGTRFHFDPYHTSAFNVLLEGR